MVQLMPLPLHHLWVTFLMLAYPGCPGKEAVNWICVHVHSIFIARCTIVQSAVLRSHVVCLSVTMVDQDHIDWKSWKLTAHTISPTSSLFIAQRSSTYSQGNVDKFWGENVRSTPTSITSGWIESTESHVILGGGVAVCLFLSAHRAVIFATAQLSCLLYVYVFAPNHCLHCVLTVVHCNMYNV